ncbi:SMP-30/gluconolactonase/LRE family protein [uncultured Alistipes sp.]|uniref:SMP-30/gluconolactonase/LRE family protein n=1 Tax=uncultured Alistipes sp. TaxID=538949 RepID=UPI002595F664|nr:SMP-30/gluconolactonase/LRE family protein [uncultured Alistipes sp.]
MLRFVAAFLFRGMSAVASFAAILCLSCESKGAEPVQPQVPAWQAPELLASGFRFTEGPAWCEDGYLLFSDLYGNKIYKWSEKERITTFLSPSESSNGICYDGSRFWVCRHAARDIAVLGKDGMIASFVGSYDGRKLNSPNDIAVSRQGTVYFTDPDYGVEPEDRELDFEGLYYVVNGSDAAVLADDSMTKPNGVALSPDHTKLYVCESSSNTIHVFDLTSAGAPANKRTLCKISGDGEVDGIACHKSGYLFIAFSAGGIVIVSPEGEQQGHIAFSAKDRIRNLCFGEDDGNTLFVTASQSLYRVRLTY